jgi:hypothetical protein
MVRTQPGRMWRSARGGGNNYFYNVPTSSIAAYRAIT